MNLLACSSRCPFHAERQAVNSNFKVGLTRLGIKPESTATEADALTARPFELFRPLRVKTAQKAEKFRISRDQNTCKNLL